MGLRGMCRRNKERLTYDEIKNGKYILGVINDEEEIIIKNDYENIANFIVAAFLINNGEADVQLWTLDEEMEFDGIFLITMGPFADVCANVQWLEEFMPYLLDAQTFDKEEYKFIAYSSGEEIVLSNLVMNN